MKARVEPSLLTFLLLASTRRKRKTHAPIASVFTVFRVPKAPLASVFSPRAISTFSCMWKTSLLRCVACVSGQKHRCLRCFACVGAVLCDVSHVFEQRNLFVIHVRRMMTSMLPLRASGQNIHVGTMMTSMLPAWIQESASPHQRVWPFFAKDNPHGHAGWPKIARKPWSQHGLEGHGSLQGEAEGYAWLSARGFLGSCCEGSRWLCCEKKALQALKPMLRALSSA